MKLLVEKMKIVVLFCAAMAAAILLSSCSGGAVPDASEPQSEKEPPTFSDDQNAAAPGADFIVQYENWIYYLDTNHFISRMKLDGSEKTTLIDMPCQTLALKSKSLYFSSVVEEGIYRSDLDGNNVQRVVDGKLSDFYMSEDSIYYMDGYFHHENGRIGDYRLYRCDLDGKNVVPVTEFGVAKRNRSTTENEIVLEDLDSGILYRHGMHGKDLQEIFQKDPDAQYGVRFLLDHDTLYFSRKYEGGEEGIYSLELESGIEKLIVPEFSYVFTVSGDKIIYEAERKDPALDVVPMIYMESLDGRSNVLLTEGQRLVKCAVLENTLYNAFGDENSNECFVSIDLDTLDTEYLEIDRFDDLCTLNNRLFFINMEEDDIYSCDTDGQNFVRKTDTICERIYLHRGDLYYTGCENGVALTDTCNTFGINRLNTEGPGAQLFLNNQYVRSASFYDDYAYYRHNNWTIYRTNITERNSEKEEFLTTDRFDFIGPAVPYDGWLYMQAIDNSEEDFQKRNTDIIRISLNSGELQKVFTLSERDSFIWDIRFYEDILYCVVEINDGFSFMRMNPDGSERKLIRQKGIGDYVVVEDRIYYIGEGRRIYRMDLDGGEVQRLTETYCGDITFGNGWIYYTDLRDNGAIWAMKLDGSDPHRILSAESEYEDQTDYVTEIYP